MSEQRFEKTDDSPMNFSSYEQRVANPKHIEIVYSVSTEAWVQRTYASGRLTLIPGPKFPWPNGASRNGPFHCDWSWTKGAEFGDRYFFGFESEEALRAFRGAMHYADLWAQDHRTGAVEMVFPEKVKFDPNDTGLRHPWAIAFGFPPDEPTP